MAIEIVTRPPVDRNSRYVRDALDHGSRRTPLQLRTSWKAKLMFSDHGLLVLYSYGEVQARSSGRPRCNHRSGGQSLRISLPNQDPKTPKATSCNTATTGQALLSGTERP